MHNLKHARIVDYFRRRRQTVRIVLWPKPGQYMVERRTRAGWTPIGVLSYWKAQIQQKELA